MELIKHGIGEHWWGAKTFLEGIDRTDVEVIVFAHTFGQRIPTLYSPTIEQHAIDEYYKHIHNEEFLNWAQQKWFDEVSSTWSDIKLINIHTFPWSADFKNHLRGVNILPNLSCISLNEVDAEVPEIDESKIAPGLRRMNHFNEFNNNILADQLAEIITDYKEGDVELDISQFQLLTQRWSTWR